MLFIDPRLGLVASDPAIVERCRGYFDELWARAGADLTLQRLKGWERRVAHHLVSGDSRRLRVLFLIQLASDGLLFLSGVQTVDN